VFVVQFDAEHCAREHNRDDAFDFNVLFFFVIHSCFLESLRKKNAGPADH